MKQETLDNLVRDNRNAGLCRVHRSVFTDPRILDLVDVGRLSGPWDEDPTAPKMAAR